MSKLRRIVLVLAASSGIIVSTATTASALAGNNHCEPRLP